MIGTSVTDKNLFDVYGVASLICLCTLVDSVTVTYAAAHCVPFDNLVAHSGVYEDTLDRWQY